MSIEEKLQKVLEALEFVRDFYQQAFDVMPVAFQTVDDTCEQAIIIVKSILEPDIK